MRALILLITLPLWLSACATDHVSKKPDFVLMSESEELKIGQQGFEQLSKQLPLLPEKDRLAQYVNKIGQRLATVSDRPELFYRFYVVDDATINAFALPGGYIFIHRGLINHMNNEAELAAVLGHEIGHVTARHAVKQITKARAYQYGMLATSIFVPVPMGAGMLSDALASAIIRGYGRDAELQSDELSIKYITRAGYDPRATIGILKTLKRLDDIDTKERTDAGEKVEKYHGAFSTHPETEKRIREAVATAAASEKHSDGLINRDALLAAVNGYAYGDSAEQGAVVGQRFMHPDLGIQVTFSKEWVLTNTPQALNARLRKQDVYGMLGVHELRKRESATEILKKLYTDRHIGTIDTGVRDGMPFAHARVKQSAPHVSFAMIDAYVFLKGSKAFSLALWSERKSFDEHAADFAAIGKSFHLYNKARDGDIPRIAIATWKAGDSWKAEAAKTHNILGAFTADRIAALNGMDLKETPKVGELFKTVTQKEPTQ